MDRWSQATQHCQSVISYQWMKINMQNYVKHKSLSHCNVEYLIVWSKQGWVKMIIIWIVLSVIRFEIFFTPGVFSWWHLSERSWWQVPQSGNQEDLKTIPVCYPCQENLQRDEDVEAHEPWKCKLQIYLFLTISVFLCRSLDCWTASPPRSVWTSSPMCTWWLTSWGLTSTTSSRLRSYLMIMFSILSTR